VAVSINLEEIVERAVPTSQGLYRVVRTEDFDALAATAPRSISRIASNSANTAARRSHEHLWLELPCWVQRNSIRR